MTASFANSGDPDQMPHSDLSLHYLLKYPFQGIQSTKCSNITFTIYKEWHDLSYFFIYKTRVFSFQ